MTDIRYMANVRMSMGIVLTGTIKPNSNFVVIKDVTERRQQYLEALEYYRRFAPVWFVENSEYDLESDDDFSKMDNVTIVKCPVSREFSKGKGYQEFEMLDKFFSRTDIPNTIIKVTGRYIIEKFSSVIQDAMNMGDAKVLVNLHHRGKYADTYLLAFKRDYYRDRLMGLYQKANDAKGIYIEHVYYKYFTINTQSCRLFKNEVDICAVSGSTGNAYIHSAKWKKVIKCLLRRSLVASNRKFLFW